MAVFEDFEKNIWLGFNGDGLSMLTSDSFEFITPGSGSQPNNIIFTGKLGNDYLLGTPAGFYVYELKPENHYHSQQCRFRQDEKKSVPIILIMKIISG